MFNKSWNIELTLCFAPHPPPILIHKWYAGGRFPCGCAELPMSTEEGSLNWCVVAGKWRTVLRGRRVMHRRCINCKEKWQTKTHQPRNARFSVRAAVIVRNKSFRDRLLDSCRKLMHVLRRRRVSICRWIWWKEIKQTDTHRTRNQLFRSRAADFWGDRALSVVLLSLGDFLQENDGDFWEGWGWIHADG